MPQTNRSPKAGITCLTLVLLLACGRAEASDFFYFFDTIFSGSSPSGSAPWSAEVFQDVAPGVVSLTISNVGLTGSEFVSDLYLNLNSSLDPTRLVISPKGGTPGLSAVSISAAADQFKADGDGLYDLHFSFGSAEANRFGANEYLSYELSGIPGLKADDFAFVSASPASPFYAATHVIGSGGTSSWIAPSGLTIPEPVSLRLFLLLACLRFGWRAHLKRREE